MVDLYKIDRKTREFKRVKFNIYRAMEKPKIMKSFPQVSEDEILEILILFQTRKIDAAREFSKLVYPRNTLNTLESLSVLFEASKELNF